MTALKVGALEVPTAADGSIWVYYAREPAAQVLPVHQLLGKSATPLCAARSRGVSC